MTKSAGVLIAVPALVCIVGLSASGLAIRQTIMHAGKTAAQARQNEMECVETEIRAHGAALLDAMTELRTAIRALEAQERAWQMNQAKLLVDQADFLRQMQEMERQPPVRIEVTLGPFTARVGEPKGAIIRNASSAIVDDALSVPTVLDDTPMGSVMDCEVPGSTKMLQPAVPHDRPSGETLEDSAGNGPTTGSPQAEAGGTAAAEPLKPERGMLRKLFPFPFP